MAAPIRNRLKRSDPAFDKTRAKVQATQIVNRLQKNALGELETPLGDPIEMTAGQIASARILLDKTLPNLSATTIDADIDLGMTDETKEWLNNR